MFRLDGVGVTYPNTVALRDVTLRIAPREVVGLIGPSGAGKTTVLQLLNGTVRPTTGRLMVDGETIDDLGERRLRRLRTQIGVVPQQFDLVPNLNVAQNVMLGQLGRRGWWGGLRTLLAPARADLEVAHQLLVRLGIGDKLFQPIDTLSGGEQQRVAIARALYQQPRALLADEPVASVDPVRAQEGLALLEAVATEHHATLVVSLHDLALARTLPRLIGLKDGAMVFDGPARDLDAATVASLYGHVA